jgi:hypothetical protein
MGIFTNRPWVNVYSRETGGSRGSEKLQVLIKLDVRMKKKDVYEYKAYAEELIDGKHFKNISLQWLLKEDPETLGPIIKEFNLQS